MDMDPFKLLMEQHRELEALFETIEQTQDPRGRTEIMERIKQSLAVHMMLEEEIFYPTVKSLGTMEAEKIVAEAYEEHQVVTLVIAEGPKVDPEDERFDAQITVLRALIEQHVKEEERNGDGLFELARSLGPAELEAIGDRMAAEVERRQGRRAA
jgi:hemerythrin-like domain-containing protein